MIDLSIVALEGTTAILKSIWRWFPQAVPTHVWVRGVELRTSVILQMAQDTLDERYAPPVWTPPAAEPPFARYCREAFGAAGDEEA